VCGDGGGWYIISTMVQAAFAGRRQLEAPADLPLPGSWLAAKALSGRGKGIPRRPSVLSLRLTSAQVCNLGVPATLPLWLLTATPEIAPARPVTTIIVHHIKK
jgi:hypothetical protein